MPVRQTRRDAVRTAEAVLLPGGKGVIAQASPGAGTSGSGAAGSTIYLISPQGIRYPLGSAATLGVLGYGGVTPLAVPGSLLALIPTGPTLDREDALAVFAPDGSAPAAPPSAAPKSGSPSRRRRRVRRRAQPARCAAVPPSGSTPSVRPVAPRRAAGPAGSTESTGTDG